jgi:phenylacetate-CoA ligase
MTPRLWNPEKELMSRSETRALQLVKLKSLLNRVYEQSPYYRDKFDTAGVNPRNLKSLEHYQEYPFFDKDEERASQEASREQAGHTFGLHITCNPRSVNRVSSSSGTTGSPTYSGFTLKDREITNDNQARALVRLDIEPGDVVMHASVLSMWIAGIPGVDSMMAYGVCLVPVGALSGVERVAQIARDTRPKSIKCTVSFAQYLAKHMQERTGIDPATLGLEKVVVFGEPGGSIPEIYEPLEKGFGGAMVHDIMGATGCHSPTGISCEEHNGIHFYAEDNAMFEICDPESLQSLPVEDGVEGEIVFTGLERECGPLIRWRDKDIIQVTTEPCRCGRPGPRMLFKGRVDDMLLVKGVNVFPNAVRDVINKTSDLTTGNIRIVKSGPGPVVPPPVLVKVEVKAGLPDQKKQALAGDLDNAIHHQLRFRATFELIDEGEFELLKGATGKTRLVEQIGE